MEGSAVDNQIPHNAPERDAATDNAGHNPATTRHSAQPNPETAPATRPTQPSTIENEVVTICGWCPELHILKLQRRDADVIVILQMGIGRQNLMILRNGKNLRVSHGICVPCREKMRKAEP